MRRYIPPKLTPKYGRDGRWWLHDKFGLYDGPYVTESEAWIAARIATKARAEDRWADAE